ncbi:MAG: hypothetical protein Q8P77_00265 [Candidatus Veblenbacteria bacterium]|nr:hypothetical protein [Candidatus Veblenbacteria bacterium]
MSYKKQILIATVLGLLAATALLTIYAVVVVAVSGWTFVERQFISTWYFVVSLAAGFGIQVGLYAYLKQRIAAQHTNGRVVVTSGTTSTAAMIACCAHYLANVASLLGIVGVVSFIGQYQRQLSWVGILFNLVGIIYLVSQLASFRKHVPNVDHGQLLTV